MTDSNSENGQGKNDGLFGRLRQMFNAPEAPRQGGKASAISARHADPAIADGEAPVHERARQLMSDHGVDPAPNNYEVWYAYAARTDRRLVRAIDDMIAMGLPFTETANDELYDKYFGIEREALAVFESSRQAEQLMTALEEELAELEVKTENRKAQLNNVAVSLGGKPDASTDLHQIVRDLLAETRELSAMAGRMGKRVERSSNELRKLRHDLRTTQREAHSDPLTGLVNQRYFDFALKDRVRQSRRSGLPFATMLVDIDGMAAINAAQGMDTGDRVLQNVAQQLSEGVKSRDIVARMNDDEFAILLPDTNLSAAVGLAQQLKASVSTQVKVSPASQSLEDAVTVAIGAAVQKAEEPGDKLLERTERALDHAKRNGGNQVTSESDIELYGRPKINN